MNKDEDRIWEVEDGNKFAHFLREGMEYCKNNPAEVGERLSILKDKFRVETKGNKVTVKHRFRLFVKAIGVHSQSYPEVTSIGEIVTAVLKDKHLSEWKFPSLSLDNIDVKKLLKWAASENKSAAQSGDSIIIRNETEKTIE